MQIILQVQILYVQHGNVLKNSYHTQWDKITERFIYFNINNIIKMNKCKVCNYEWKSKTIIGFIPKSCPKCKRYDWQEKKGEKDGRQTN